MPQAIAAAACIFIAAVIGLVVLGRRDRARWAEADRRQRARRQRARRQPMEPITQVNEVDTMTWPNAGPKVEQRSVQIVSRPPRQRPREELRGLDLEVDGVRVVVPEPVTPEYRPDRSMAFHDRHRHQRRDIERELAELGDYAVLLQDRVEVLGNALTLRPILVDPVVVVLSYGPATAAVIGRTFDWSREERNRHLAIHVSAPPDERLVDFCGVDDRGEHLFALVDRRVDDWLYSDGVAVDAELLELTA
ncbi:hypothetical protein [Herbaspirillum sp.]|uniref:hypothetical protein n=1 Tax=Herbaspirillum sp. TaxID=1890675 RepID=UPI002582C52D|nr:hypothetical protein [Herbaspirillum sp.]MCP3948523.1 hypothetical protein [Herbaspirillum sp.]